MLFTSFRLRPLRLFLSIAFFGSLNAINAMDVNPKGAVTISQIQLFCIGRVSSKDLMKSLKKTAEDFNPCSRIRPGGPTLVEMALTPSGGFDHGFYRGAIDIAHAYLSGLNSAIQKKEYVKTPNRKPSLNPYLKAELYFYDPNLDYFAQFFSNCSKHQVKLSAGPIPGTDIVLPSDLTFNTAEHAYQAMKVFFVTQNVNRENFQAILQSSNPGQAKTIAKAYDIQATQQGWHRIQEAIMCYIVACKVAQHPDVRWMLAMTGKTNLFENTPIDNEWGIGPDGAGANKLGKILMDERGKITITESDIELLRRAGQQQEISFCHAILVLGPYVVLGFVAFSLAYWANS